MNFSGNVNVKWLQEGELKVRLIRSTYALSITLLFQEDMKRFLTSEKSLPFSLGGQNGRVAMLAFLGLLVQEFVHLPDPMFSNPVGTEAMKQVPLGGWPQIFLFCGVVELITMKGDYNYVQYAQNADKHIPGDFGFNPLNLKVDQRMKEAEVKYVLLTLTSYYCFLDRGLGEQS